MIHDLRNWQQVKGNADHAALKAAADKALDYQLFSQHATCTPSKKKKKKKKVQSEHPPFEYRAPSSVSPSGDQNTLSAILESHFKPTQKCRAQLGPSVSSTVTLKYHHRTRDLL